MKRKKGIEREILRQIDLKKKKIWILRHDIEELYEKLNLNPKDYM